MNNHNSLNGKIISILMLFLCVTIAFYALYVKYRDAILCSQWHSRNQSSIEFQQHIINVPNEMYVISRTNERLLLGVGDSRLLGKQGRISIISLNADDGLREDGSAKQEMLGIVNLLNSVNPNSAYIQTIHTRKSDYYCVHKILYDDMEEELKCSASSKLPELLLTWKRQEDKTIMIDFINSLNM